MGVKASDCQLDLSLVRRSFSRAAEGYDRVAVVQREMATRLQERLDYVRLCPARVLDAGAGTGQDALALARRYPGAEIVALDWASSMLRQIAAAPPIHRLCGDLACLPLAPVTVDLIYSNAALQWCNHPERFFAEALRVLRPGGLLMFTTFGPDTLRELRAAWAQVDDGPHVSAFIDMHHLGDALVTAGFADPVMDVEQLTLTYEQARDLMRDLKQLGAHNRVVGRRRGLTGKGQLAAMLQAYETFRWQGRLPATYEVIYGHAWAPRQVSARGETCIGLEQMRALLTTP